jgi:hypothetical protein
MLLHTPQTMPLLYTGNHPAENSNPVLFSGSASRGIITARLSASLRAIVTTTASVVETRARCTVHPLYQVSFKDWKILSPYIFPLAICCGNINRLSPFAFFCRTALRVDLVNGLPSGLFHNPVSTFHWQRGSPDRCQCSECNIPEKSSPNL